MTMYSDEKKQGGENLKAKNCKDFFLTFKSGFLKQK